MSRVLVICAKRYNGHELWVTLGVLRNRGHKFDVVSQDKIIRDELTLRPNTIDRTVWEVSPSEISEYDGIMVVSGNMSDTEAYWDDDHVQKLLRESKQQDLAIAAICCSVPTLSCVVEDTKVSFYPLVRSRERLNRAGAVLQTVAMTRDGKTVTAEHQMATEVWVEEFCNVLEGKPQEHFFHDSKFVPRGKERKPIEAIERIKEYQRRQQGVRDQ